MAPAQSRLIFAFAAPAVLVFTLYWLKRRQFRIPHPPTDPGGESKDKADFGALLLDKEVCQIKKEEPYLVELEQEEEIKVNHFSFEEVTLTLQDLPEPCELPDTLNNQVIVSSQKKEEIRDIEVDISEEKESENSLESEVIEPVEVSLLSTEVLVVEKSSPQIVTDSSAAAVEEKVGSWVKVAECIEPPTSASEKIEEQVEKVFDPPLSVPVDKVEKDQEPAEIAVLKEEIKELEVPKQNQESVVLEVANNLPEPQESSESLDTLKLIESQIIPSEEKSTGNQIIPSEECDTKIKMESCQVREDLAKKLSNLELAGVKIEKERQKMGAERDSANHSPSEVMLGSPSISNFSDAHSEGSSDSGKGHSDPTTSPSRTPAGGSSLAGDTFPSLYEFILPQANVGRLIGRHGSFLQEIRTSTNTNIFIKRHPDTNKLKICAIEGTQQDIDKALTKIRQKFPLRRFPQLTLEKVSFVSLNPPPLKPEDFHLQLVEGVNNDVVLSSLISAGHFFLQQPSHPSYLSLGSLNRAMNEVYSSTEAPVLESPIKDAVCAAPTMGGWYRAQIVEVDNNGESCTVRFLDYGGYLVVESSALRQIRGDLLMLPFQAVECYLANVAPKEEEGWSEEAKIFVHGLTHGRILQAQIYDYAEDSTPLVYLYTTNGSEVVLVNEQLVAEGYGVLTVGGTEE